MSTGSLSKRDQATLRREAIQQRYKLGKTVIHWTGIVCLAYFARDSAFELAGKETALAFKLAIIGDIKFVASLALAGIASAWAIVERYLRNRKTETMSNRIKTLEELLDKDRTSSGLTRQGKTNPRDK